MGAFSMNILNLGIFLFFFPIKLLSQEPIQEKHQFILRDYQGY